MDITASFLQYWNDIQTTILPRALHIGIEISPLVLVFILYHVAWAVWLRYVRAKQFFGLKYTVLELRLPKETNKSPLAMEVFLNSLHNTAQGSWYAQFWRGETRPWYSLEIASVEGQVKFYIWTEDRRKKGLIAQLYGQYPEMEIKEVEDYTKSTHFDPKTMKLWACEIKYTKDEPYPIKTYVDYGLDKDPKEEYKVDPMVPLLEWLASLDANQQGWIQILIQAHMKENPKEGHIWARTDKRKDGILKLINKEIMHRDPETKIAGVHSEDEKFVVAPTLTKGEQDIIAALERALQKQAFDVGIRCIYLSPKETFDTPHGIGGIISSFKHFSTEHLNGLKQNGDKWIAQFDYPWQDYNNVRRNRLSKKVIGAYKRRSYFYYPNKSKPLVMTTEELATIYHFPGSVAATPTLERVPSKKSTAPANLPVANLPV